MAFGEDNRLNTPNGQNDKVDTTTEFLGKFGDNQNLLKECIGTGDDDKKKFEDMLNSDSDGRLTDVIKQILENGNLDEGQKKSEITETLFLQNFEGREQELVKAAIQKAKNDINIDNNALTNLLMTKNATNFLEPLQNDLKDGIAAKCSDDDLILLVRSVIAEHIGYKVYNASQTIEKQETAAQDQENEVKNRVKRQEAEAGQAEAEAGQAEAEAGQAKSNAEKIEAEQKKEVLEKMNIALESRTNLLQSHQDVAEKTEIEAKKRKQQLSPEIKKQIEKKYGEDFIDNYILLKVTYDEVKNDSRFDNLAVEAFGKQVDELSRIDIFLKNIDNSCNIADTRNDSFSSEKIGDTRKNMFNDDVGNHSLIEARNSNKNSHKDLPEYAELFKDETMMDTIKKYGKFFPDKVKHYLDEYKKHYEDGTLRKYERTAEGKKIREALINVKKSVDDYTQNFMEEMCLMMHIKGMTRCVGENFSLNKANEIKNENGVLSLHLHVDGADFGLRHNTNNPKGYLQTSSKLSMPDEKSFKIGSNAEFPKDQDTPNTNFVLPSQQEIFAVILQRMQTAMGEDGELTRAGNREEFKKALEDDLQKDIMSKVDNGFEDNGFDRTTLTHRYIGDKIKKERVLNNAVGLIEYVNPNDVDLSGNISEGSNPKLFSFIKILNYNLENSSPEEKDRLDKSITKIKEIIAETKNKNGVSKDTENREGDGAENEQGKENKDSKQINEKGIDGINTIQVVKGSIAEHYLKNSKWTNKGDNDSRNSQRDLISEMFSKYSEDSQFKGVAVDKGGGKQSNKIINDLYHDLFRTGEDPSGTSKIWADEQKLLANAQIDKQDHEHASDSLQLGNKDLRDGNGQANGLEFLGNTTNKVADATNGNLPVSNVNVDETANLENLLAEADKTGTNVNEKTVTAAGATDEVKNHIDDGSGTGNDVPKPSEIYTT